MAQTKRRRQTKHRGNAAGAIESRGRTGRKPTSEEKSSGTGAGKAKKSAAGSRAERYEREPTWRGAVLKAMAAAVMMLAISYVLMGSRQFGQAAVLFPLILAAYVPISYYSDLWLYRRRRRTKAAESAKTAKAAEGAAEKTGR
ncbi:MAG TPA: hypothetical protein VGX16_02000 [Solirubrobacteraceae bacterium]|jgi:hypothetical protein|nr:hypothetical protein [Solirubrobacteraceae bacterium]